MPSHDARSSAASSACGCAATEEENYYRGYILPANIERSVAGRELDSVNPTKQNALRTGDTFVFNNPSEVWTVTGVTDESVTWESPADILCAHPHGVFTSTGMGGEHQ